MILFFFTTLCVRFDSQVALATVQHCLSVLIPPKVLLIDDGCDEILLFVIFLCRRFESVDSHDSSDLQLIAFAASLGRTRIAHAGANLCRAQRQGQQSLNH